MMLNVMTRYGQFLEGRLFISANFVSIRVSDRTSGLLSGEELFFTKSSLWREALPFSAGIGSSPFSGGNFSCGKG